jgi:glutathione reductase (NADPH)
MLRSALNGNHETKKGRRSAHSYVRCKVENLVDRAKSVVLKHDGMKPSPLNIPGEDRITISDQFLELDALPPRIIFIGGGSVGK